MSDKEALKQSILEASIKDINFYNDDNNNNTVGAPGTSTRIPLTSLCAHPLALVGFAFPKSAPASLDASLQAFKVLCPKDQRTGSILVFMSPQGTLSQ